MWECCSIASLSRLVNLSDRVAPCNDELCITRMLVEFDSVELIYRPTLRVNGPVLPQKTTAYSPHTIGQNTALVFRFVHLIGESFHAGCYRLNNFTSPTGSSAADALILAGYFSVLNEA